MRVAGRHKGEERGRGKKGKEEKLEGKRCNEDVRKDEKKKSKWNKKKKEQTSEGYERGEEKVVNVCLNLNSVNGIGMHANGFIKLLWTNAGLPH